MSQTSKERNVMTQTEQKETLEAVDARIDELNAQVELGQAIERLHNGEANADDFKTVILEGYMDAEAERLFGILTNPTFFKRDQMANTMDRLGAIRNLKEYFMVKLQEADAAPDAIEGENNYRSEVTAMPTSIDAELVE